MGGEINLLLGNLTKNQIFFYVTIERKIKVQTGLYVEKSQDEIIELVKNEITES